MTETTRDYAEELVRFAAKAREACEFVSLSSAYCEALAAHLRHQSEASSELAAEKRRCEALARFIDKQFEGNHANKPGRSPARMGERPSMAYCAGFPGAPGYSAVVIDDPKRIEDTAIAVANYIRQGATMDRVPIEVARERMKAFIDFQLTEPAP